MKNAFCAVLMTALSLLVVAATSRAAATPVGPLPGAAPGSAAHSASKVSLAAIPLFFEQNMGQTASPVKFLSRTAGGTLFLTGTDAVMTLRRTPAVPSAVLFRHRLAVEQGTTNSLMASLRIHLVGANPASVVRGEDEQAGKSNYFIGNNPAKWRTGIANYRRVRFNGVYPGVDVVYYGARQRLEHDFIVQPGASASSIRMRIDGASQGIKLDRAGNLEMRTAAGNLTLSRPEVYQEKDGRRDRVDGRFLRRDGQEFGFAVGQYDRQRPLIIDPVIYSTYLGGTLIESATGVAVDATGNAYVAGYTDSVDFPTTPGAFQAVKHGGASVNVFVTKLNASGSGLIYSTYLGGSGSYDVASGIAIDAAGAAYVAGRTLSSDFPTTPGAFQTVKKNDPAYEDTGFVTKLNPGGTGLIYSTYLGGSRSSFGDDPYAIAVDGSGNAYVAGHASAADFPTTPGAFQTVNKDPAQGNAFVTKLNPGGTGLVYSTFLGGSGQGTGGDSANAIAVDGTGQAYVAGVASSPDFPTTAGAYQTVNEAAAHQATSRNHSGSNATADFVTKLNGSGTGLVYSTFLTGALGSDAWGIAIDSEGSTCVVGSTRASDFPTTPGALQTTITAFAASQGAGTVTRLNASGTGLVYSTFLGGGGGAFPIAVALDPAGNAYVAGSALSHDFPTTPGAFQSVNQSAIYSNGFVSKLDPTGTTLLYSTYLGGSSGNGGDEIYGIALDSAENIYAVGVATSTNFPITPGAYQTDNISIHYDGDAFVTKLSAVPSGPLTVLYTYVGSGWRLIASPYTISQTFSALSVVAYSYDSASQAYVLTPTYPADTFHIGVGYWVYLRNGFLDIPAPGTPVDNTRPFTVSLDQGWNLIGNPFTVAEPVSNLSVINSAGVTVPFIAAGGDNLVSNLFAYEGARGGYTMLQVGIDQINPWDGVWIYSKQAGTKLVFNPSPP